MSFGDLYLTPTPSIKTVVKGQPPVVQVFGVPFDATSSYRPGSRFGPNAIREAFLNIEVYSHRLDVDLEKLSIDDLGNLHHTANSKEMASHAHRVTREIVSKGFTPAILGGEHSITYATFTALPRDTAFLVFDAHLDLRDEYDGFKLGHATFLRRLIEKRKGASMIHVGARAASAEEWRLLGDIGLATISSETVHTVSKPHRLLDDFLKELQKVYVSIDIDVLDPAYAPGVGNPEPGGLTTRQLLDFLYALKGKKLVGFDIMEVCPPYDNGSTAAAAAKFLAELTSLTYLSLD